MKRMMAEPHGPFSEALRRTDAGFGSLPRTYLECTQDSTIPIVSQQRMQELVPGARTVTLKADHSPFLSRPRELADATLAVADGLAES